MMALLWYKNRGQVRTELCESFEEAVLLAERFRQESGKSKMLKIDYNGKWYSNVSKEYLSERKRARAILLGSTKPEQPVFKVEVHGADWVVVEKFSSKSKAREYKEMLESEFKNRTFRVSS